MAIIIGKQEFEGPVTKAHKVAEMPGIYAVLHHDKADLVLVEIAESANLSQTVESLKNIESTSIVVFACEDQERRTAILKELREEYDYEDKVESITLSNFSSALLESVAS